MSQIIKTGLISDGGIHNDDSVCGGGYEINVSVVANVKVKNAVSQPKKVGKNSNGPVPGKVRTEKTRTKNKNEKNIKQKSVDLPDEPKIRNAFKNLAKATRDGRITDVDIDGLLAERDGMHRLPSQPSQKYMAIIINKIEELFLNFGKINNHVFDFLIFNYYRYLFPLL